MKFGLSKKWVNTISPKGGNDSKQVKGKPFNCDMDPDKNLFMKLKQFREQHRSRIYKEVQAN